MSATYSVVAVIPADERRDTDEWKRMKRAWDACQDAGVATPAEVQEFFSWQAPRAQEGAEVIATARRFSAEGIRRWYSVL